jgi:DNA-binding MarR family transcriptional regulator
MADGTARAKSAPRQIAARSAAPARGSGGASILDKVDLRSTPGHLLRRAQQRAVELFVQAVGDNGLRPPQFAALVTVYQNPGINQTLLVDRTGIDRSTVADVIDRMVSRGYIERKRDVADQRVNTLWITEAGIAALEHSADAAMAVQEAILAPVPPARRAAALEILELLADLPPERTG